MSKTKKVVTTTIITLVLATPVAYTVVRYQAILDWWALRNYQAPSAIAKLANDTTMVDSARRVFYINRPQLQDKASFYGSCTENEKTAVLGCYIDDKGIFILDVTDERLHGVEEVTAAHEMLHAAYDRMGADEKQRISALLNNAYQELNNTEVTEKINLYKQANADITNELHSILGTEVANLPAELEAHYRLYFSDRRKIVNYSNGYKAEFTSRKARLEALTLRLSDLEKDIASNNAELDKRIVEIDAEEQRVIALRSANHVDEYNAAVPGYNAMIQSYNNLVNKTRNLVNTYKTVLNERNAVAEEAQALVKALDNRISTKDTK